MMDGYFNITQLSKILNISTETLRHYDRIGLFKPDYIDPETYYRYYAISQIEHIDTILELKKMGMKLSDIKDFMENRTVELSYQLMTQKEKELKLEINEKKNTLKTIKDKIKRIEKMLENDYAISETNWQIKNLPEEKFLVSENVRDESRLKYYLLDITILKQNLKEKVFIFATNYVGSLIEYESFSDSASCSFKRQAVLPLSQCRKKIEFGKVYTMPSGEYLCGSGNGLFTYDSNTHKEIIYWLKCHNYEVNGNPLEFNDIDISLTNNNDELVFDFRIPVRKIQKKNFFDKFQKSY